MGQIIFTLFTISVICYLTPCSPSPAKYRETNEAASPEGADAHMT